MNLRIAITGAGMLVLAGCTTAQVNTVTTSLATAQADASEAVTLYNVALGIAEVAAVSEPTLAPTLTQIEAVAGPIVSQLEPLVSDASADASTIESLVSTLKTQANSLTVAAAPAVKVTAG
jgi:hypothetical protein